MRLAQFIVRDMHVILAQWEAFAATRLPAAERMPVLELNDHARQILEAVVVDLGTAQTPAAQSAKSKGLAPVLFDAPETAAQTHAVLRAKSGFDIEQLVSEYRALRASVLTLWMQSCEPGEPMLEDLTRFNEAIDQALAESVAFFTAHVERSRNLLIGMLSHDLRSPLQTIQITARFLRQLDTNAAISQAATRLINSGARMQSLLGDLMDYNRMTLGLGIRVTPALVELGSLCADELERIRVAHLENPITLDVEGDCHGTWDGGRIQQLLCNLVENAVHYGAPGRPVDVKVQGRESDVQVSVANSGPTIDGELLSHVFEPLRRGPSRAGANDSGLGLGLYIAAEIAKAHGGEIKAKSENALTVFTVQLPRRGLHSEFSTESLAASPS